MNDIEIHPFEPWLPKDARLLMLGTFPPAPKRWCMEWYYPNFQNDMWRIMGICFYNDRNHFVDLEHKSYHLDELKSFLKHHHVAIFDTCMSIRRTTGTASDKDLEVIEKSDLDGMLRALPDCKGVVCAGQLATTIFTQHFNIKDARKMKMGGYVEFTFENRILRLYRMPSSSRAYPMATEKKADYYQIMFNDLDI
jgi:G:T/U-mismatch repair DNA glycosylase